MSWATSLVLEVLTLGLGSFQQECGAVAQWHIYSDYSFFIHNFTYGFIVWLCWIFTGTRAFLQSWRVGAALSCQAQASHCSASLAVEQGPGGLWASVAVARGLSIVVPRPWNSGSVLVAQGLSCPRTCGISPDQGSNPRLLNWQADSSPPSHLGIRVMTVLLIHVIVHSGTVLILA